MTAVKIQHYVTAIAEAMEASYVNNCIIYLYRVSEGGYVYDSFYREYSNEKLIGTFFKGQKK